MITTREKIPTMLAAYIQEERNWPR